MRISWHDHILKEGEEVIATIYGHWLGQVRRVAPLILAGVVLVVGWRWFLSSQGAFFVLIGLCLGILIYIGVVVLLYYSDCLVVTNQRLIDYDQPSLLKREVSEIELANIQDVTYSISGFFQTLFNVGTVKVETSSRSSVVEITYIHHPAALQSLIVETKRTFGGKHRSAEEEAARAIVQLVQKFQADLTATSLEGQSASPVAPSTEED